MLARYPSAFSRARRTGRGAHVRKERSYVHLAALRREQRRHPQNTGYITATLSHPRHAGARLHRTTRKSSAGTNSGRAARTHAIPRGRRPHKGAVRRDEPGTVQCARDQETKAIEVGRGALLPNQRAQTLRARAWNTGCGRILQNHERQGADMAIAELIREDAPAATEAERIARERYPNAERIVVKRPHSEVYCEVWTGPRTWIYLPIRATAIGRKLVFA